MKRKIYFMAVMSAIVVMISGCEKGDTGPQGPPGVDGLNGNANVSTSNDTVSPSQWNSDGAGGWNTTFNSIGFDPTLGALNAYWSTDDLNWAALPWVAYTSGSPDVNYTFNSTAITVYYDPQTGVTSIAQPSITEYFKFVVIPPASRKPGIDNTNWITVKTAYNLKD